jgi:hypothetical protein
MRYTAEEFEALCELHDPVRLAERDKIFFVTPDPGWMPEGDLPRQLPRLIGCVGRFSDERQSCRLQISDDLDRARRDGRLESLQLRVLLEGAEGCADRLFCVVNGERIDLARFGTLTDKWDQQFHVLDDPPLHRGENTICFLLDGVVAPEPWPRWLLCDVAVRYSR